MLKKATGRSFEWDFSVVIEVDTLDDPNICVLIVEDFEPFRQYISAKIEAQPNLQIVGQVCDGGEAVLRSQQLQPDLVLMDVGLPTLNGIEAARRIQKVSPNTKILFVSENRSSDVAKEALRVGGLGYVVKSDAERDLLPAISAVLEGKRFVNATLEGFFLVSAIQSMVSWIITMISGMC